MIRKEVKMQLSEGLEARPIALLVQEASQYASQVYIEVGNKKINAKSIMGMMTLQLKSGDVFHVTAEGPDEVNAVHGVESFFLNEK